MSECGTRSSYVGGCRCAACTEANRVYVTEWRHRTGRTDPTLDWRLFPSPHGTVNRYDKYGCRCAECREANRAMVEKTRRRRGVQPVPQRAARAQRWPQYYGESS